jgi:hypothetical protein
VFSGKLISEETSEWGKVIVAANIKSMTWQCRPIFRNVHSAKSRALGLADEEPLPISARRLLQCISPLMAQSGHASRVAQCPLLGAKRTNSKQGREVRF